MKYYLLFLMLFFSSCSWFSKSKSEVGEYAPTVVHSMQKSKTVTREPGSLWSEDSRWNDMYSPGQSRFPGDILMVSIGQGLKNQILQAAKAADPERKPEKVAEKKEGEESAQEAEGSAGAASGPATKDTKTVEATIIETLARNTFRIASNKGVHIASQDPYVVMYATVREQDIGGDRSVNSDALYNVQLEVISPDKITNKKPVPEEANK